MKTPKISHLEHPVGRQGGQLWDLRLICASLVLPRLQCSPVRQRWEGAERCSSSMAATVPGRCATTSTEMQRGRGRGGAGRGQGEDGDGGRGGGGHRCHTVATPVAAWERPRETKKRRASGEIGRKREREGKRRGRYFFTVHCT